MVAWSETSEFGFTVKLKSEIFSAITWRNLTERDYWEFWIYRSLGFDCGRRLIVAAAMAGRRERTVGELCNATESIGKPEACKLFKIF